MKSESKNQQKQAKSGKAKSSQAKKNRQSLPSKPLSSLIQRAQESPNSLTQNDVMSLQSGIGNRATQRLVSSSQNRSTTQHTNKIQPMRVHHRTAKPATRRKSKTKVGSPTTQRQTNMVIQRALGMELECTTMDVTETPKDAIKGNVIESGTDANWKMTLEDTFAGQQVVEFIVDPPVETEEEFRKAVQGAKNKVDEILKAKTYKKNGYTIEPSDVDDAKAAIQLTISTPLENVLSMFEEVDKYTSFPSTGLARFKSVMSGQAEDIPKLETPDGQDLTKEPKSFLGFLLLAIEYLRRTYVSQQDRAVQRPRKRWVTREEYVIVKKGGGLFKRKEWGLEKKLITEEVDEGPETVFAKAPFTKSLLPIMARTDFNAIFSMLPNSIKARMTYPHQDGTIQMKANWVQWIIDLALGAGLKSQFDVANDLMINYVMENTDHYDDLRRNQWLSNMPSQDKLKQKRAYDFENQPIFVDGNPYYDDRMGVGKLGNKVDYDPNTGQQAIIFELRKPFNSSESYANWMNIATQSWEIYQAATGKREYKAGGVVDTENDDYTSLWHPSVQAVHKVFKKQKAQRDWEQEQEERRLEREQRVQELLQQHQSNFTSLNNTGNQNSPNSPNLQQSQNQMKDPQQKAWEDEQMRLKQEREARALALIQQSQLRRQQQPNNTSVNSTGNQNSHSGNPQPNLTERLERIEQRIQNLLQPPQLTNEQRQQEWANQRQRLNQIEQRIQGLLGPQQNLTKEQRQQEWDQKQKWLQQQREEMAHYLVQQSRSNQNRSSNSAPHNVMGDIINGVGNQNSQEEDEKDRIHRSVQPSLFRHDRK